MVIKLVCIGQVLGSVFMFKSDEGFWITMTGCFHGFECTEDAVMLVGYRTIRFNQPPDFTSNEVQLATII